MNEIIVGNIGCVYRGPDASAASRLYDAYVANSKLGIGRATGESVTWLVNNEILEEHIGNPDQN